MTTQYNVDKWVQGVNGYGLRFCDDIYSADLKANTEATVTVPISSAAGLPASTLKNKFIAVISVEQSKSVFCSLNSTATVPAGSDFTATTSDLLQTMNAKYVQQEDVLHFITAGTANISVSFFAIQDT